MGRVQTLWDDGVLDEEWGYKPTPDNTHIFMCGNPAMIKGMIEKLESQDYVEHSKKTPGQIHAEKYW